MKIFICILSLLFFVQYYGYSQVIVVDSVTKTVRFQRIEDVPNTSKSTLYNKAKQWINAHFPNARVISQKAKVDSGSIYIRPSLSYTVERHEVIDKKDQTTKSNANFSFNFKVSLTENRCKLVIDSISPNSPYALNPGKYLSPKFLHKMDSLQTSTQPNQAAAFKQMSANYNSMNNPLANLVDSFFGEMKK